MTKCFNPVGERPDIFPDEIRDQQDPNYTNKGGLSRLAIFNQVNAVRATLRATMFHLKDKPGH